MIVVGITAPQINQMMITDNVIIKNNTKKIEIMKKIKCEDTQAILKLCEDIESSPASTKSKGQRKKVIGFGENDVNFCVSYIDSEGKNKIHPAYICWRSMLHRCYSKNYQKSRPSYIGCSVDTKWLKFSNFLVWWKDHVVFGYHLDKDLLIKGNKVYSEDSCIFVPPWLNSFITNRKAGRGDYKIEVTLHTNHSGTSCFHAQSSKVFGNKTSGYLGTFKTEEEAYQCWLSNKISKLDSIKDILDGIDERLYQNIRSIILEME